MKMSRFPTKKRVTALFVWLVLVSLFSSVSSAQAFLDVPYNISTHQLDALDFMDFVPKHLLNIMLLSGEMSVFAIISGELLDFASSQPVDLKNPLVKTGWDFTSGLVNIIFILIFVFIAFSYILKLENLGMKKALPRLIIIAFLLNFSLLFVKMFVDVGWIFQNSFKEAFFVDGKLTASLIAPLLAGAKKVLTELGFQLGAYAALGLVPFGPAARMGGWLLVALPSEIFFGSFSYAILLIIFGFTIGLTFLVYGILFLMRIAVIWLLAIIAPLALAAYILPQTEKYFKQWLGALLQWTFLGVIAFFFAGMGIRLFTYLFPNVGVFSTSGASGANFDFVANYTKFFFLIIYLWISLIASIKLAPKGTEMLWKFGEMALGAGTALATGQARKWGIKTTMGAEELKGRIAQARIAPLRTKEAAGTITPRERSQLGRWTARQEQAEAKTKMLKGLQVQEQKKKLLEKIKNMDEETAKLWLSGEALQYSAATLRDKNRSQAFVELLADKSAFKPGHRAIFEEASKSAGPDDINKNRLRKLVLTQMPQWAKDENEMKVVLEKMSPTDIDKLNGAAKADEKVIKAIIATNKSNLISRLGSQNAEILKKVQKEVEETIGKKWRSGQKLEQDELRLLRSLHTSPSFTELGFETYGDLSEIQEKIKGAAPKPAEKPKLWTPGKGEPEMPPKPKT